MTGKSFSLLIFIIHKNAQSIHSLKNLPNISWQLKAGFLNVQNQPAKQVI